MDIVIPIVFLDYLITVRTSPITFRVPNLIPGYDLLPDAVRIPGHRHTIPELGHAGVLFINGSTGTTKYYEYGRYDRADLGWTRRVPIPDVDIARDGHPTTVSLVRTLTQISRKAGHGGRIVGVYIEAPGKYAAMLDYARGRVRDNGNSNREPYHLTNNSCIHFTKSVLEAAGVDTPVMIDPRPNSYIDELRDDYPSLDFRGGRLSIERRTTAEVQLAD